MAARAPRLAWPMAVALLSACGGAEAATLAKAVIDTLPGGIPRVMSGGPTGWSDSSGAHMVEVSRFSGEEGSAAELGEPRSMAVDEAGRVYIVDSKPAAIKVYAPDGTLIRTLGREGEGPGEFRVGFIAVRGGIMALHDPQLARTSVWDTSGTFLRSWHTSCCYWSDIQVDKQGRIYVPSMSGQKKGDPPKGVPYVRYTTEGTLVDTLWVPSREDQKTWTVSVKRNGKVVSMMSTSIPFMPGLTWALDPNGGVLWAWTGAYSIVRSQGGRDTAMVFGRSWTADAITDARRTGELESKIKESSEGFGEDNIRAAFHLDDIPKTLPAFENIRVDETGRIWVRRYPVADTTRTFFDVFDRSGAYLGPVSLGLNFSSWGRQAWTPDGVVLLTEDRDGRPTVVKMRLEPGSPR